MTVGLSFLPGQPNPGQNSVVTFLWKEKRYIVYCSGNNLVVICNNSLIQTIYLGNGDGIAVAVDLVTGRLAVSTPSCVQVYFVVEEYSKPICWSLVGRIEFSNAQCIAFSGPGGEEMFVGGNYLELWTLETKQDFESSTGISLNSRCCWSVKLANPLMCCSSSPDGYLVATYCKYDRLVKVWRRSSFDTKSVSFDFVYLTHPTSVTHIRWKHPISTEHSLTNSLYTLAGDGVVRLWSPFDEKDSLNLQLWASIDVGNHYSNFYACFIDSGDIMRAIESSVKRNAISEKDLTFFRRDQDLIMAISKDFKFISVYSLENVGSNGSRAKLIRASLVSSKKAMKFKSSYFNDPELGHRLDFFPFFAESQDFLNPSVINNMGILVHENVLGVIFRMAFRIESLVSTDDSEVNFLREALFTGHKQSVRGIVRAGDGNALLTYSREAAGVWKTHKQSSGVALHRHSILRPDYPLRIRHAVVLKDHVVTMTEDKIVVWDCRNFKAFSVSTIQAPTNALCFFQIITASEPSTNQIRLAAVYSNHIDDYLLDIDNGCSLKKEKSTLPANENSEIHIAAPVDPVGWSRSSTDRDSLITISEDGVVKIWSDDWSQSGYLQTDVHNIPKMTVSSTKKVAATDETNQTLFIWDIKSSVKELEISFSKNQKIADIDWTTSPSQQCVLGVGFTSEVVLYCQLRYDYTNKVDSWVPIKSVDISGFTTHPIGDSLWLKDGTFVVGAGNQFFIQDKRVEVEDEATRRQLGFSRSRSDLSIFDICDLLNGPLPFYHPQLLIQSIFAGKQFAVKSILKNLLHALKFETGIDDDGYTTDLDSTLKLNNEIFWRSNEEMMKSSMSEESTMFSELMEYLTKVSLKYLTRHQQITLASVVEALSLVEYYRRSIDEFGVKFLVAYHLYQLHRTTQEMVFRDFSWALHSQSQDILLTEIESKGQIQSWAQAKSLGIPYWINTPKLCEIFERIARTEFTRDDTRDPVRSSLYYLALKKKHLLVGLWKTSSGHKEQAKTLKILQNDFTLPRWREAALKNAYALLGKHRYEYAAAWFLLGDSVKSATDVICRNLQDPALAVAVARVYSGEDGLSQVIDAHIMTRAEKEKDRWQLAWCYWMKGLKSDSVLSLAVPNHEGVGYLLNDPVLSILYQHLRGYSPMSVKEESDFVLHVANVYVRMGCEVLALSLVRNWKFNYPKSESLPESQLKFNLTEPVQNTLTTRKVTPTTFSEPDLMSSFDFGY